MYNDDYEGIVEGMILNMALRRHRAMSKDYECMSKFLDTLGRLRIVWHKYTRFNTGKEVVCPAQLTSFAPDRGQTRVLKLTDCYSIYWGNHLE